ncbi:L,D-transpeptidase [Corynebacterium sanguinis]|uniref:Murein L,D-transpeptidase n=1 Tax=Corynebacterium sanguinis TaxID=2594913 RepID=A0A6C1TZP0_9CORY|nr:L,D-transpeptidase [Corynebacterium sanguinis]MCT2154708.1 L,D-transpeptidase [Corynebacterium sanguinis]TVS30236.1 murein L,D-transpeptidase [Corynebacterium sanguinis]
MSNSQRRASRLTAVIAAVGACVAFIISPAAAHSQQQPITAQLSANPAVALDAFAQQSSSTLASSSRDAAWNVRESLIAQAGSLAAINPALPEQARAQIDQTFEALFPGLLAEHTPPAPAPAPASAPAPQSAGFDYGACPKDAKVCVDIAGQRSWLQSGGQQYYVAEHVATGKPGYETPRGTFYVNRKVKDEISYEFGNAPMPFATYFTYNGIAFHQGDPAYLSHGCVRMHRADAERYFNDLRVGDKVVVY